MKEKFKKWYCSMFHTWYGTKDNKWYCKKCNKIRKQRIDWLGDTRAYIPQKKLKRSLKGGDSGPG